jgi:hypothetical protein
MLAKRGRSVFLGTAMPTRATAVENAHEASETLGRSEGRYGFQGWSRNPSGGRRCRCD